MIAKLKISCKIATGFIDKKQIVPLTFSEKVQLRLHTSICSVCRRYEKQSVWIEEAIKHLETRKLDALKLPESRKNAILEKII